MAATSDFVQWSLWRRSLQHYADAAAEDGAKALQAREPVRARALTEVPAGLNLAQPPIVLSPPRAGAHAGRTDSVYVRLTAKRAPFFTTRLLGPRLMVAEATAAVLSDRRGGTWVTRIG